MTQSFRFRREFISSNAYLFNDLGRCIVDEPIIGEPLFKSSEISLDILQLVSQTVSLARNAMATRFEMMLHGEDELGLRAAGEEALDEISGMLNDGFESALS